MAANGETHKDLRAHQDSYGRFLSWFKTGTIVVAIIAAAVVFIITR